MLKRQRFASGLALLSGSLGLLIATASFGASEPPSAPVRRMVSLAQALELANHQNLDLATKYIVLDQADARVTQAHAASFPKIMGTAILSPIYSAIGDAQHSVNDLSKWGVWLQSSVTVIQPLYTWGKLSNYRDAAGHGVEVARAQVRKDVEQLAYSVKELYYGAVLAEQLYAFLEEGKHDVEEVLKKADEDQKKKRPSIAKRDYYRLKIFAAEASYRFDEAVKLRGLARHALSLLMGFDPEEETLPEQTALSAVESAPPTEETLIQKMAEHRPEFSQLTHGIAAKKALLVAERTNKYPMFFAGGMFTFAYSNMRNGQQSAYAFDPYNRASGGAGFGVQWSWDFATTLANESMLQSEIDELEKKELYARSGFRMELKKALSELVEARSRLETSRDAFQTGKRWLVSESMGYSLGVTEIKNLIDAYLGRAKTVKDHWEAIYRVNMAWAELSRVIGTEITPGIGSRTAPIHSPTKNN